MLSTNPRGQHRPHQRGGSAPGEMIVGRYQVLAEIGRGSTGQLFLVSDVEGDRRMVLKRAADAALLRHEADVLGALDHPNVTRLRQRHDDATPPFLLLEPIEGSDLEAFLGRRGGRLDELALGRLLLQLADTVDFIHAAGFLHRDLKPANVMIRPDGSPVLVDFGAAARREQAGADQQWSFVTDGYAAPEQYFSDQREGPWTDVYGLAALACRALRGAAPAPALIRAGGATGEPLAADRDVAGDGARALRQAIDWALEPEAADRPQSMTAWRERLAAALAPMEEAAPPAAPAATPAAAGPAGTDDYPPTIRVARARSDHADRPTRKSDRQPPAAPGNARKRSRALPIVLVLAVLAAAGGLAGWYGWPLYERYIKTEWLVDQAGGGDATTISDALARAGDGARIRVAAGTYAESLRLERPASLVAQDGATPVVAPESGPCILATSRTGSITGLDLRGAASAPCVVLSGGAVSLEGNRISGASGPGVVVRDGADPVVHGNRLEGVGLVVTAGGRGTITENSIAAAGASLVVRGGADPSLSDNVIEGGGVVFAEGALGSLIGNRLLAPEATGIQIATGAGPRIIDNTIEGAGEAGIFVYDAGGGRLEGNVIAGSRLSGVVIAGGGRPELVGNTVRDNGEHGVLVVEGGHALLEDNQIMANQGHGIALAVGSEVELTGNRLEANDAPQLLDAR